MENLTGGTPPVRYLPCVVPCKLYFTDYATKRNEFKTANNRLVTELNLNKGFIIPE